MAKIDHCRAKTRDQQRETGHLSTTQLQHELAAETSSVIAGMGKGRYSKAAGKHMGAEPTRRIDPNSPEGRAIAAKFAR